MVNLQILSNTKSLGISYDKCNNWIYVDWIGCHTEQSVKAGCEQVLYYLSLTKCQKILNDNSNLTCDWAEAAIWVGRDFMPRLMLAGLYHMAWVYSPNCLSRRATDIALSCVSYGPLIASFEDVASAYGWLRRTSQYNPAFLQKPVYR